jgi:hypothetical protein
MLRNRSYQNAWRRRDRGVDAVLPKAAPRKKKRDAAQLEFNFCAKPWRAMVIVAAASTPEPDRPMTEDELDRLAEKLFGSKNA